MSVTSWDFVLFVCVAEMYDADGHRNTVDLKALRDSEDRGQVGRRQPRGKTGGQVGSRQPRGKTGVR